MDRAVPEIHHGPIQHSFGAIPNAGSYSPQQFMLKDGQQDGSFIADELVKNGFRLKMLKEEEIDLEDVFMGITKGITQ